MSVRSCGSVNACTQDSHWIYEAAAGLGLCRLSKTSMGFSTCRFRAKTHRPWDLRRFESLCVEDITHVKFCILYHFKMKQLHY